MIATRLRFYLDHLGLARAYICSSYQLFPLFISSPENAIFVINHENMHWVCLVKTNQHVTFFDPLGVDLVHYSEQLVDFISGRLSYSHFITLAKRVQSWNSKFCAKFCLFFLYNFCVLRRTVSQLEQDLQSMDSNDFIISSWLNHFHK